MTHTKQLAPPTSLRIDAPPFIPNHLRVHERDLIPQPSMHPSSLTTRPFPPPHLDCLSCARLLPSFIPPHPTLFNLPIQIKIPFNPPNSQSTPMAHPLHVAPIPPAFHDSLSSWLESDPFGQTRELLDPNRICSQTLAASFPLFPPSSLALLGGEEG
jgi:hypothetical protein